MVARASTSALRTSTCLIELTAKNVAPPDRIAKGAINYVAWYRKDSGKSWTRIAALTYNDGSRNGELEGASMSRPSSRRC